MSAEQKNLDEKNAEFWSELCGTGLAQSLGLTDQSADSLEKFDKAYFGIYPYLLQYVPDSIVNDKRVLEIGLGYGTLSQNLIERGSDYHGLDISPGPVAMVRYRMRMVGKGNEEQVTQGSALAIPHEDESLDTVVSIGCLHHTGDLRKSIGEVARVLKPGGTAVVMIYNYWSLRQIVYRLKRPSLWFRGPKAMSELNWHYDANSSGDAAPHIDYTSPRELRGLFPEFTSLKYEIQNMDPMQYWKGRYIAREHLLTNLGRVVGLDLYVTARK